MSAPGFITRAAAKATGHSVDDTYDIFNLSGKMANATRETTAEEIAIRTIGKIKIPFLETPVLGSTMQECLWLILSLLCWSVRVSAWA